MAGTITLLDQDRGGEWDPLLGQTVGSYRIARLLGRGGMGAVYLARQPAIGAQVAIKFLHPRFSADRAVVERFFNEARAVNLIGHENIVKILDFSVTPEGRYYFVMEYLDGQPLSKLVAGKEPLPLAVTGPILLQCCRALQAAHARGIVHRDLKPDNVFLVQQMGRKHFVKLVDFGIAKLEQEAEGAGLTQAGTVIGTPEYMSPEQAAGRTAEVGKRSDVYSLGCVIYQLACGRVPFSGASTAQTLVQQMEAPPPPPRQVAPGVPEELEAIVLKALAKKKEDRFQSMQELHAALSAAMQKLGVSAELPPADEPAAPGPPGAPDGAGRVPEGQARDPRLATAAAPPTQTRAGAPSPSDRLARLGDWLLAPSRRVRTLLFSATAVAALIFVARARGPEPAPRPAPAAAQPSPRAPAAPAPPPAPAAAAPPQLRPASPAQLALAGQEKAKHKPGKKGPAPAKPAAAKPAEPAPAPAPPKAAPPAAPKPAPAKAAAPAPAAPPAAAAPPGPPAPLTAAEAAKAAAASARPRKAPETEAEKAARAAREMGEAAAAAAREEAALPSPPRSARLYVVSDPPGAQVTAAWAGKSATGETPVVFRVLRGAKVTLTFSKPGWAPAVLEIPAAATRLAQAALQRQEAK